MASPHPHEDLILFSDKRQREHRRRQSVIAVDDTDLLLYKRATRRSILYGGDSQGPKFWNQLKSVWDNHRSPSPSPTSVRDLQGLNSQQEEAISNAYPNFLMADPRLEDTDDLMKVSHRTVRTSVTSTSSLHTIDSSSPAQSQPSSRPFCTVWEQLDAWSHKEHRAINEYHFTVEEQNQKLVAAMITTPVVVDPSNGSNPSIRDGAAIERRAEINFVPGEPHLLRGRLRRQNSWNGQDSARDLLQARGSVMAIADDCSLSVLDGNDSKKPSPDGAVDSTGGSRSGLEVDLSTRSATHRNPARARVDECVINLVM